MRTQQLTTAEAAATLHVTPHTIAAWCRRGLLAATKTGRRWAIAPSTLARLLCPVTDRLPKGMAGRQLTGRALARLAARQLARATSRAYRIPLIGHHQRARIAAANAGHLLVRDYLFTLDMDVDDIEEFESAAGRKVAEVYRKAHHAEPDGRGLVILHGRLWRVMRYTDATDLEAGLRAYARTSHLIPITPQLALAA